MVPINTKRLKVTGIYQEHAILKVLKVQCSSKSSLIVIRYGKFPN